MIKAALLLSIALSIPCLGQEPRPVTSEDSLAIFTHVEQQAQTLVDALNQSGEWDQLTISFQVDTFKIEERWKLFLDIDYSTSGMVKYTVLAEGEYRQLVDQLYQLLLSKLNNKDQNTLIEAQNNWLQYSASERELNSILSKEEYSDGGSIQVVYIASRNLDVNKQRALELYRYLLRLPSTQE